ncbi:MgtC/SapB family protein [Brevundimonas sp. R86498]|uniref:MgtC/SapB family protein n=1 Tax=Brevundimonas sp. R86498 TaxID=3093845 RepID=UPI0037CC64A5
MIFDNPGGTLLPVLGAVIAGGLIGFEREWRGRPAGLRTHILVSLASALLMLAATSQADWAFAHLPDENIVTDPTRMAHGILTGIGFLCAGVIFRTGFFIHGLTTAASLWITAAIGILFGAGLFALGALGTVITVVILMILRLVNTRLPARPVVDLEVQWARTEGSTAAQVEARLAALDGEIWPAVYELMPDGLTLRRTWRLTLASPAEIEQLATQLGVVTGLGSYRLVPRDD